MILEFQQVFFFILDLNSVIFIINIHAKILNRF